VLLAARGGRLGLAVTGYAIVVIAVPFVSGGLLRAVAGSRSSAGLAAAIAQAAPAADVLAVATFPTSLPFYLDRTIQVSTADPSVLTSNYIAAYEDRLRVLPGSRLQPGDAWRPMLEECPVATVFVVRSDASAIRTDLARLPLILDDGRNAAYGPCIPHA
jgi:hypothetical protein